MNSVRFIATSLLIALLNTGCANIPDSLEVNDTTRLIPFADVRAMPQGYIGETARWGGIIASIDVKENGTVLEVVSMPLNSNMRPKTKNSSEGRFRVITEAFLDPVIYSEGRKITAVGVIGEGENDTIGEYAYLFPVLKSDRVYLWKKVTKINVHTMHSPWWHSPYYWQYAPVHQYPTTVTVEQP
ncbi:Slp family lipoprotein [Thalassotalea sp. Y01]|uniref:Slp family lipoprotein n=1 Tax=Thalassotalea sp. Y01 TaxID=2729613 RepID=UPI00145EA59E|nr:Slp family lipoprotein [Thalassotalea sp. Y01]NMP16586.1 Slp/YeaY family lipoprotein [Thalassotalea sp. Y01]